MVTTETSLNMSISAFLASLGLEQLREVFDREQITVDILSEMGHEDLKQIGVTAFGHRHKLIKGIEKLVSDKKKQVNKRVAKSKNTPTPRRKNMTPKIPGREDEIEIIEDGDDEEEHPKRFKKSSSNPPVGKKQTFKRYDMIYSLF